MKRYLPPVMWTVALVALFFMNASSTTSLCLSTLAGLGSCPGCGIGHSIHYTLHLQFREAMHAHWLGIPSTIALIWQIARPFIKKHTRYEPTTTDDAGTPG